MREFRTFEIDMLKGGVYSRRINFKSIKRNKPVVILSATKDTPSDLRMIAKDIDTKGFTLVVSTSIIGKLSVGVMINGK